MFLNTGSGGTDIFEVKVIVEMLTNLPVLVEIVIEIISYYFLFIGQYDIRQLWTNTPALFDDLYINESGGMIPPFDDNLRSLNLRLPRPTGVWTDLYCFLTRTVRLYLLPCRLSGQL